MIFKCLLCFVFVVLPIECYFEEETCPDGIGDRPSTCKQLSKCTHLLNEIRRCGTPMPSHMRRKLQRLGCGFDYDEPLVCCDSISSTINTQKPFTSRPSHQWESHEYGQEDRYDKRHYSDQNEWSTSKPNRNPWGTSGNQDTDNTGGGDRERNKLWTTSKPNLYPWGMSGNQDTDNTGGGDRERNKLWTTSKPNRYPWGTSGNQDTHNTGGGDRERNKLWTTSKPNRNPWGTSGNQDPYNSGGVTDPYTINNGGGNRDDINNLDSNQNTPDNSIERTPNGAVHRNINLLPTDCGAIESERIFGGNRTKLFEMPWMVLLSYDSARGTKLSCGGTLITERYVLTAAHCIAFLGTRLRLRSVVLGEYDVRRDPDCERLEGELFCAPKVRNVAIETLIPHPDYSPQQLGDDIGLIRLAEPADFTLDSMKPICLPTTPELQAEKLEGLNGVVAGWGATEDGLQSPVLLSVDLPIISNRDCQAIYNGSPRISDSQLCAGGVLDKDSCGGDSGGPLMYPGRTKAGLKYVQRGVVSYGSKRCGLGGFPGVYTRVANYMDWILDNIRE